MKRKTRASMAAMYGVSPNERIDVGIQAMLKAYRKRYPNIAAQWINVKLRRAKTTDLRGFPQITEGV